MKGTEYTLAYTLISGIILAAVFMVGVPFLMHGMTEFSVILQTDVETLEKTDLVNAAESCLMAGGETIQSAYLDRLVKEQENPKQLCGFPFDVGIKIKDLETNTQWSLKYIEKHGSEADSVLILIETEKEVHAGRLYISVGG